MTHDDIFFILRERNLIVDFDKVQPPDPPAKSDKAHGTASPQRSGHSRTGTNWTIRKRSQQFATARVEGSSSRKPHIVEDPHGIPTMPIPTNYKISFDPDEVAVQVEKWRKKDYITLKPDRLQWTPFLVSRGYGLDVNVGSTALDGTGESEVGALGGVTESDSHEASVIADLDSSAPVHRDGLDPAEPSQRLIAVSAQRPGTYARC